MHVMHYSTLGRTQQASARTACSERTNSVVTVECSITVLPLQCTTPAVVMIAAASFKLKQAIQAVRHKLTLEATRTTSIVTRVSNT